MNMEKVTECNNKAISVLLSKIDKQKVTIFETEEELKKKKKQLEEEEKKLERMKDSIKGMMAETLRREMFVVFLGKEKFSRKDKEKLVRISLVIRPDSPLADPKTIWTFRNINEVIDNTNVKIDVVPSRSTVFVLD